MMSPSTLARVWNRPTPAEFCSFVRSPRRKFRRFALNGAASPASIVFCIAVGRFDHSSGMPLVPLKVSIVRWVGPSAAIGPAAPVAMQVAPAATPLSTHEASQLAVEAIETSPVVGSTTSDCAVSEPDQLDGL